MAHAHDADREPLATIGRTFAVGIVLNVGFVILKALYGWRAGSLALLADAFHNLSDVGGLLLAWAGWQPRVSRPTSATPTGGDVAPSSRASAMPFSCW